MAGCSQPSLAEGAVARLIRKLTAMCFTGLAALAVAGCFPTLGGATGQEGSRATPGKPSGSPTSTPFVGNEDFQSEYSEAVSDLSSSLPEGAELPETPDGTWDPHANYEAGAGYMVAAFAWQCRWMDAYLDAADEANESKRIEALARLESWIDLPGVAAHTDAESRQMWDENVVGTARDGDDAVLRQFAAQC